MIIKDEITDLADFEAWSGGEYTKDKIIQSGYGEDFMTAIEEHYPDGLTATELNDLLWFEEEWCYSLVGLNSHGVEPKTFDDLKCEIDDWIDSIIDDYNRENGTNYTSEQLLIARDDFESSIDAWLEENQEDETDESDLAMRWIYNGGRGEILEAIEEKIEELDDEEDVSSGDMD